MGSLWALHAVSAVLAVQMVMVGRWLRRYRDQKPPGATAWLTLSAGSLVLGAAATAGLGPRFLLLGLVLGGTPLLALQHPVVAVNLLIAHLLLRPWELLPDNPLLAAVPRALALLAVVAWLVALLRGDDRVVWWSGGATLAAVFLGWTGVSNLGMNGPGSIVDPWLVNFLPIVVLCLLVTNVFSRTAELEVLRRTLVLGICGVVVSAMIQTAVAPPPRFGVARLSGVGLWGNANDIAALIIVAVPFAIALMSRGQRRNAWWSLPVLAVFAAGLVMAASRGAFVALGVMGAVWAVLAVRGWAGRLMLLGVGLAVPFLLSAGMDRDAQDLELSQTSRWNYLVAGIRMARSYPILGVGMGNYSRLYERFTPGFAEWGERTAHSSWVLALAETGPLGLALFAALFLMTLWQAWRLRGAAPEVLLAVAGYGVAMSFLSHTFTMLPWLLFSIVIAVSRVYGLPAGIRRRETAPLPLASRWRSRLVTSGEGGV